MDSLKHNCASNFSNSPLQIGDWVTSYHAGYWQVIDIYPKYADSDYSSDAVSYKKGDQIGEWVVLKKGFTSKMKFSVAYNYVDSYWVKPVNMETLQSIKLFFANNPDKIEAYRQYPVSIPADGMLLWANIPQDEIDKTTLFLHSLPQRFTLHDFTEKLHQSGLNIVITKPPTTHAIPLLYYGWELTKQYDQLYFSNGNIKEIQ